MWITRVVFDALNAERIQAQERAKVLADQNAQLQTTVGFLQHRLEQVERERAHLLKTYMGVVVEVPQFVKSEPAVEDVLGGANVFADVGDEAAKVLGLGWNGDGTLKTQ